MNKVLTAADINENTVRAHPNGTGPAPDSPRTLPAKPGVVILWQFAYEFPSGSNLLRKTARPQPRYSSS